MLTNKAAGAGGFEIARGEAVFTGVGVNSWTVPAGVTSISVVAIGGGGGGCLSTSAGGGGSGGDLRYHNNLSVTPGETLTITVGEGGIKAISTAGDGGLSRVDRSGAVLLEAAGGGGGTTAAPRAKNGTSSTIGGSIGGGDGGAGATASGAVQCGGGGGAGGYSGNGGVGRFSTSTAGGNGSGGGGGGGGGGGDSDTAGNGGGVTVFGEGPNGNGGTSTIANGNTAGGGSYGDGSLNNNATGASSWLILTPFGGGGGGDDNGAESSDGGQGAVRVVWPGFTRSFPSTDVWMSDVLTTVIETQKDSSPITIPASAAAGDLAVLVNMTNTIGTQSDPSGWTRIINQETTNPIMTVWYRILQAGDPGTTVTMTPTLSAEMVILRKAAGTVASVSASGATIDVSTAVVSSQTQTASTATPPFIVFGALATTATTVGTYGMYFVGGLAGSTYIEPSVSFSNSSGDSSRQVFLRFRIYDTVPPNNVVVTNSRDVGTQTMGSFILQVT